MKRILGIGNALVDVMTIIDEENILKKFSLPKGSMQLVDIKKSEKIKSETIGCIRNLTPGGSAANTIYGLSKLGVPTGFIGSIGYDETGDFFEKDFTYAGVRTMMHRRKTPTGTAVAFITPDSERTFATYLGAAVELNAEDLKSTDFAGFDILYLEGYLIYNKHLVAKACRIARSKTMKIALDLSSYNVVQDKLDDFKEIVEKYVDIIFANEEEAKAFTGCGVEEALIELSRLCDIVILKVGAEGSWIKRGKEVIKIKTIPVNCRDTTGAGDLYASGFLYGLAKGESLRRCGLYGAILSGKVIEVIGARMDNETWKAARGIMSKVEEF
jgi:sugar/nucleoside kinase (ribokinase family)